MTNWERITKQFGITSSTYVTEAPERVLSRFAELAEQLEACITKVEKCHKTKSQS